MRLVWDEPRVGSGPRPLHRQVRAAQIVVEERAEVVSFERAVDVDCSGARSVHTSVGVVTTASFPPLQFNGGSLEIQEAARLGWNSLRAAMRTWCIAQLEDLTIWLRNQGFPGPQVGSHISARAQEYILSEECRHDARVRMLEAVYITTTLELGRRMAPVGEPREVRGGTGPESGTTPLSFNIGGQLG